MRTAQCARTLGETAVPPSRRRFRIARASRRERLVRRGGGPDPDPTGVQRQLSILLALRCKCRTDLGRGGVPAVVRPYVAPHMANQMTATRDVSESGAR